MHQELSASNPSSLTTSPFLRPALSRLRPPLLLRDHAPILNAALPTTALAATSEAKTATANSRKINTQPTSKTATSNISSDGDGGISDHYQAYDPGGNRLNNTDRRHPSMRRRRQHAHDEGDNTRATKATIRAQRRR
jgi:hypothetical protein